LRQFLYGKIDAEADIETVAVIDFETTGLSPESGDRATEIAILLVRDFVVVDRYQSLMNSGRRIPAEVTCITGITNEMVANAQPSSKVMGEAARFVGRSPIVAHNASFDQRFWKTEIDRVCLRGDHAFACTMLLSRRIYPDLPNHQLTTIVEALKLRVPGKAHRAMVDAEMASLVWRQIQKHIETKYRIRKASHEMLAQIQRAARGNVHNLLSSYKNV
jgi:DNA polymerase III subunit epsilon